MKKLQQGGPNRDSLDKADRKLISQGTFPMPDMNLNSILSPYKGHALADGILKGTAGAITMRNNQDGTFITSASNPWLRDSTLQLPDKTAAMVVMLHNDSLKKQQGGMIPEAQTLYNTIHNIRTPLEQANDNFAQRSGKYNPKPFKPASGATYDPTDDWAMNAIYATMPLGAVAKGAGRLAKAFTETEGVIPELGEVAGNSVKAGTPFDPSAKNLANRINLVRTTEFEGPSDIDNNGFTPSFESPGGMQDRSYQDWMDSQRIKLTHGEQPLLKDSPHAQQYITPDTQKYQELGVHKPPIMTNLKAISTGPVKGTTGARGYLEDIKAYEPSDFRKFDNTHYPETPVKDFPWDLKTESGATPSLSNQIDGFKIYQRLNEARLRQAADMKNPITRFPYDYLPHQKGGRIKTDPLGYWNPANEGKPVRIPGNSISMDSVPYKVYGVPDQGQPKIMSPQGSYSFPKASSVVEYPFSTGGAANPNKKEASKLFHHKEYYAAVEGRTGGQLPQAIQGGLGKIKHNRTYFEHPFITEHGLPSGNIDLARDKAKIMNWPTDKSDYHDPRLPMQYGGMGGMGDHIFPPGFQYGGCKECGGSMQDGGSSNKQFPKDVPLERKTEFLTWLHDTSLDKLHKDMTENPLGLSEEELGQAKKGGGFKLNPNHAGWCSPMTKSTCTGARRQFAINAKNHFKKQQMGGVLAHDEELPQAQQGFQYTQYDNSAPYSNLYDYIPNVGHPGYTQTSIYPGQPQKSPIGPYQDQSQPFNQGNTGPGNAPFMNTPMTSTQNDPNTYNNPQWTNQDQQTRQKTLGITLGDLTKTQISDPYNKPRQQNDIRMTNEVAGMQPGNMPQVKQKHIGSDWFTGNPDMWNVAMEAGTNILNNLPGGAQDRQKKWLRSTTTADWWNPTHQGSRGDYDANSGRLQPQNNTPVQYSGNAGSYSYQKGGQYYMNDNDIQQLRAQGYKIREVEE